MVDFIMKIKATSMALSLCLQLLVLLFLASAVIASPISTAAENGIIISGDGPTAAQLEAFVVAMADELNNPVLTTRGVYPYGQCWPYQTICYIPGQPCNMGECPVCTCCQSVIGGATQAACDMDLNCIGIQMGFWPVSSMAAGHCHARRDELSIIEPRGNSIAAAAPEDILVKREYGVGIVCKDTNVPCKLGPGLANCPICTFFEMYNRVPVAELDWFCLGVQLGFAKDPCAHKRDELLTIDDLDPVTREALMHWKELEINLEGVTIPHGYQV